MSSGSPAPARKLADGPWVPPLEREREGRVCDLFYGRVIPAQPGCLGARGGHLCDPIELEGWGHHRLGLGQS
jgi:hypothetical protein